MKSFPIGRILLTICLTLAVHGSALAAVPAGWETVDVLDRRLTIVLPKGARPVVNGDARPNQPGEQRISHGFEISVGKVPMEVIVTEMLARSGDPIHSIGQEYARRLLPENGAKPVISLAATKPNGVDVVTFSTSPATTARDSFLVRSAILRRPDNLLMRLDFYVRDAAAVPSAKVGQAIDTVVSSIHIGPRQLPTGKGVTLVGGELTLDLLPGYAAMEEARSDSTVVNIMPIVRPGQKRGTLAIYVGHNVRFCQSHSPAGTLRLFGRKGVWDDSESRDDWLQRDVCLIDPSNPYDAPQVKIRVQGPDKKTEKELVTILESVRSKTLR